VKLTVLGAGAWGTALALVLHRNGRPVTLWATAPRHLEDVRRAARNERYLPGIDLPHDWLTNRTLLAPWRARKSS